MQARVGHISTTSWGFNAQILGAISEKLFGVGKGQLEAQHLSPTGVLAIAGITHGDIVGQLDGLDTVIAIGVAQLGIEDHFLEFVCRLKAVGG